MATVATRKFPRRGTSTMCGIVGYWSLSGGRDDESFTVNRMAAALAHRGPDAQGCWLDAEAGIGLGHRRLSILDLSAAGHQPMHSSSGRFVIVFNGEIYNFSVLRQELEQLGINFRGTSDTEVILAAVEAWGLEQSLKRSIGMFAIALWDRETRTLALARDRFGEKPLYYGWMGSTFLFGSEIKALRTHPAWRGEISRESLALQLSHSYVGDPNSIYRNILKLTPGTILTLRSPSPSVLPEPRAFWSLKQVAEHGLANPLVCTPHEAVEQLDALLRDTVAKQMVADVPLGAFLSGGIDSSTIAALMQSQSTRPVKTFTIGFSEVGYNEAEHAKAVARHLGTDHTELYVTPREALETIPKLPFLYDEPFSDSSQIPTFLVAQLARRSVSVSLSGDAGDEMFGGYNRYLWGRNVWKRMQSVPFPLRGVFAIALKALSPQHWDSLFNSLGPILPVGLRQSTPGDKIHKLADVLQVGTPEAMYRRLSSHWQHPESIVLGVDAASSTVAAGWQWENLGDFAHNMMYADALSYLPGDILVKVDRAAMGVGLETRVPFLDHRVVEFAWHAPLELKIRGTQGKWLLRQVLNKYVPEPLFERPKRGFAVPIDQWLRGPLREWADSLLDVRRLCSDGYFVPEQVRQKWEEHLLGTRNWQHELWDILMFLAWVDIQKRGTGVGECGAFLG